MTETQKNPHAVALGALSKGKPRNVSPEVRQARAERMRLVQAARKARFNALVAFYKEHHDGRLP